MGENYFTYYDTMMLIECLKDHPEKATDELKEAATQGTTVLSAGLEPVTRKTYSEEDIHECKGVERIRP